MHLITEFYTHKALFSSKDVFLLEHNKSRMTLRNVEALISIVDVYQWLAFRA